MYRKEDFKKEWYRTGEVANYIGVSSRTIRNYCEQGTIQMRWDSENKRWYMSKEMLLQLLDRKGLLEDASNRVGTGNEIVNKGVREDVIYVREESMTGDNEDELVDIRFLGQIERIKLVLRERYGKTVEYVMHLQVYGDIGGIQDRRVDYESLMEEIMSGRVNCVYVATKVCLYGENNSNVRVLEKLCKRMGVRIIEVGDVCQQDSSSN